MIDLNVQSGWATMLQQKSGSRVMLLHDIWLEDKVVTSPDSDAYLL